ncbi:MAG: hypothetical protein RR394_10065 [Oscillospiraceae bacterium]
MNIEWGNCPEDVKPKMYWGARAIIEFTPKGHTLVVLPDRQSFEQGADVCMDKDDFMYWINSKVLPAICVKVKEGFFREWGNYFRLISDSGVFHCEATPKNSGGSYLYIGCWEE